VPRIESWQSQRHVGGVGIGGKQMGWEHNIVGQVNVWEE